MTKSHEQADLAASVTDDAFLGGALHILQPEKGYRAGIDAVLLAAAAKANSGACLDVGSGVGVAGLCLARRVEGMSVTLFEKEPSLVQLAAKNIARNGLGGRVHVIEGAIASPYPELENRGLRPQSFAHVIANPPYHARRSGTRAQNTLKDAAHAMDDGEIETWARFFARMTPPGGMLTLIHKTEALGAVLAALDGRFAALRILPIHPRANVPAIRVIIQGVKGSQAPLKICAGLLLHEDGQTFTPSIEAVLRHGAPLSF